MKKSIFIYVFLVNFILLIAQTQIPVGNVSGTWDLSGSPYLIEGEIEIPDDQTLTIDPGCVIEFQGHYKFNVQGRLLAIGTEQDSIRFTIADTTGFHINNIPDGGWDGLHFPSSGYGVQVDTCKFVYSILEYGKAIGNDPYNDAGNGGAFYSKYRKILISNSLIRNNSAYWDGGGIWIYGNPYGIPRGKIINNIIEKNVSGHSGGGIYSTRITFINNIIQLNKSQFGGGASFSNDNGIIACNLIVNNIATDNGGGIRTSEANIINCTITNNIAEFGGGISCYSTGLNNASLLNCIVYGNESVNNSQIYMNSFWVFWGPNNYEQILANIDVFYSDIENGYDGIAFNLDDGCSLDDYDFDYEDNIDSDPHLIDPDNGDFHFFADSPCINAGTQDTTGLNLPNYDLDGNPRIYDEIIDMGCYEWQGTPIIIDELPVVSCKLRNYPNPFNPSTTIEFSIQNDSIIELTIYNIKGQKINILTHNEFTKGSHSIIWNGDDNSGSSVSSGIYFYKLNINGKTKAVRRCLLLK